MPKREALHYAVEPDDKQRATATTVRQRVADWNERLTALRALLEKWVNEVPGATVLRGQVEQVMEHPMKVHHLKGRSLPTLSVLIRGRRIGFVPSALWMVGANGRVNVTTGSQQHTLVDLGGRGGKPSKWCLVVADSRQVIPFGKDEFRQLLREA